MPKNTEEIKENIKKLVDKYTNLKAQDKVKTYNEAQTRNEFIEPLFEFLGWDMRNLNVEGEVITEEKNSNGRVDLAFRINGIPKFFLEAKSMKTDLDNDTYARQAINYSWNKGVMWAVLSDFEGIKIFNAQAESNKLRDKLVFEINYDEYISDFDRLWLLSKESFENNALDVYAEKHGKKSKKMTVNEKLFDDLRKARELLTKSFESWNRNVDKETLDEGIQKILDRLVFIRVLEDRELEQPILKPIIREWEKDKQQQLFHMLIEKFRELDEIYNSNLFTKHACEEWEEYDHATKKAIEMLYGNDMYEYDFKEIPADILGGVYESYLGYIAQNPILDRGTKKGQLFALDSKGDIKIKSRAKRKEHGIFYTPKFIVDYIVKNTLGEKLKEINNISDLKKIKVLDPACGSGSFLTRALEEINAKYKDFNNKGDQYTKTEILLSNVYGVDLDAQAVEIAKLNLLIDALDKREKLPNLTKNIHVGNSLISGTEKELKKYFGKNWQDKKPFNWEENFSEVFRQGGFDVIIGNPPYISFYSRESSLDSYKDDLKWLIEKFEFTQKYSDRRLNTVMFFIEKSLILLKPGGHLGFVVDANFIEKPFRAIRRLLNERGISIKISEKINEFEGVNSDQVIVILQNKKENNPIEVLRYDSMHKTFFNNSEKVERDLFNADTVNLDGSKIILSNIKTKLEDIAHISTGVQIGIGGTRMYEGKDIEKLFYSDKQEGKNHYKNISLKSGEFFKYSPIKIKNWINLNEDLACNINRSVKKCNIAVQKAVDYKGVQKIFIRQSANAIIATLGDENTMSEYSAFMLKTDDLKMLNYLLALLNSKLLTEFSLHENIILTGNKKQPQIRLAGLKRIPVPIPNINQKNNLANLAQKMLDLNKQLTDIQKDSDKWNLVKEEIERTDKLIDQKVYELYGLTEEEIKIVENK